MVVVCTGNVPEHFETAFAAWKLGACVLPLSPRLPAAEQAQILEAVGSNRLSVSKRAADAVVGDHELNLGAPAILDVLARTPTSAVTISTPHPGKAIGSGGSTGRSKVIVDPNRWEGVPGAEDAVFSDIGFRPGQIQLVAGPLYHNSPFSGAHYGLFDDHTLIVMERFDAGRAVDLIEEHRVEFVFLAPTMMLRISRLPDIDARDLSSLTTVYHTAMSCPGWLKRHWIGLVGANHLHEAYGASENIGYTTISGEEWLQHPGSVGHPRHCEIKVLAEDGTVLPAGQVGLLYLRSAQYPAPTYRYLGSEPLTTTPDGFATVGDLGWLDDDGYLYIADRRTDLIITGGVNVYPAEVEAALLQNPAVADAVVIGIPDVDWGHRVHAIVQPADRSNPPAPDELHADISDRLQAAKRPKSYEFVAEFPRDESGKVRRSALVAERTPAQAVGE
jgi:bile acid-coenzyme A ligase